MDAIEDTGNGEAPLPANRYSNRELSWLAFNQRVLAEACNPDYPLLERLRFLSISGSNLDEFTMVRIAGLAGQIQRHIEERSVDGLTPSQQLAAVRESVVALQKTQQDIWRDLRESLAGQGIAVAGLEGADADRASAQAFRDIFRERVFPIITPQAIDPAHPFPFVANQGMGLIFSLERIADGAPVMEMVLIPAVLPRFVRAGDKALYISIEDLVSLHAAEIFPGFRVLGHGAFRVLRDSDIEVEEDAEDLVRYFRTAIQRRRRGQVIALQLQAGFDPAAEALLRGQLGIEQALVTEHEALLDMAGLRRSSTRIARTSSSSPTARATPNASANTTAIASRPSARKTSSSSTPTKASRW